MTDDKNAAYEKVIAAIQKSEKEITNIFTLFKNHPITYASIFGLGVGRRALALSSGFRSMVEQCNSLCAMPIVRMQLDTSVRLYAGFFAKDHQQFCFNVLEGKQINKMKSNENKLMYDRYLVERVAKTNPWIKDVYEKTSGYIHFSHHHIQEAIRIDEKGNRIFIINGIDFDRKSVEFLEPLECMLHLNAIIKIALQDWYARMCNPSGVRTFANEL